MSRSRSFNAYYNIASEQEADKFVSERFEKYEPIEWCRGQLERKESGVLHVQIVWGYKNARYLSAVQKHFGETVQITKDPDTMIQYCTDERKRVGDHLYVKGPYQIKTNSEAVDALIREAKLADSYQEALDIIDEGNPRFFISQHKQIMAYFRAKFGIKDKVMFTMDKFNVSAVPDEILKVKTIVIYGPTSYGKTSWAMAHFKCPAVIKSKLDYIKITDETDGLIFDDMNFANWSMSSIKNLTDLSIDTHQDIKYSSVHLKKELPRFICVNTEKSFWPKEIYDHHGRTIKEEAWHDVLAVSKRCIIEEVKKPLFDRKCSQLDIVKNPKSKVVTQVIEYLNM